MTVSMISATCHQVSSKRWHGKFKKQAFKVLVKYNIILNLFLDIINLSSFHDTRPTLLGFSYMVTHSIQRTQFQVFPHQAYMQIGRNSSHLHRKQWSDLEWSYIQCHSPCVSAVYFLKGFLGYLECIANAVLNRDYYFIDGVITRSWSQYIGRKTLLLFSNIPVWLWCFSSCIEHWYGQQQTT